MIAISNVHQSFRTGFWMKQATVLHDISFEIPARSVFGFLGANGAGKTTLIQLMVGLREPTRGTIQLEGVACTSIESRSKIGYLPERPYFHEHLTGERLLAYFGSLSGMTSNAIKKRIPHVLEEVGMSHAGKMELKRYSKGMLQRIGIAQAILHDPKFLVLDEPMSGLDPVGRKEMRELITRLAAEGRTLFFSSHVIPDVEAVCNQVVVIQKGKIIGCGPINQLLSQGSTQVELAFNGINFKEAEKMGAFTSLKEIPEGLSALLSSSEAMNSALGRILAAKGNILWVNPVRPSLEDFFL